MPTGIYGTYKPAREPKPDTRKRSRPGRAVNTYSADYLEALKEARFAVLKARFHLGMDENTNIRPRLRLRHILSCLKTEIGDAEPRVPTEKRWRVTTDPAYKVPPAKRVKPSGPSLGVGMGPVTVPGEVVWDDEDEEKP